MYKSPIELICQGIGYEVDKGILKAVLEHGINVDKDELIRALQYDRDQYNKGYSDGKRDAADELVRCKDCVHYVNLLGSGSDYRCSIFCGCYDRPYPTNADDFCSYGERREGE